MPPTESQILSTFLLPPASVRTLVSLSSFTNLFPQAQRKNPQIPYLYSELHHQRGLVVDQIKRNIAGEVKKGEAQRRAVVKARRRDQLNEANLLGEHDGEERYMEVELFGQTSNLPPHRTHTLASIIPEMESAATDLEAELRALEEDSEDVLARIRATVGDLSDLRYGKFEKQVGGDNIAEVVLEELRNLEWVCEGLLKGDDSGAKA
ncbi:hypothetical protein GP486_004859 [Trichoglossum hirsutum]|uniref:Cnl2/NKP2 family protein n=1 Tax=Trichoglossum hirsutum TaxID=265104 RepID=A0A9P8RNC1_9PEZI|nr:hypothetical protein GP486_004859 [Trichoglossum hirsutum]